jgi:hypothetical protein
VSRDGYASNRVGTFAKSFNVSRIGLSFQTGATSAIPGGGLRCEADFLRRGWLTESGQSDGAPPTRGENAELTAPYWVTPAYLQVDPTWAPLRGNPRSERLVAGK